MATTGESRTSSLVTNSSPVKISHKAPAMQETSADRRVSMEVKPLPHAEDKTKKRNIHVTAKYNRKQMRLRLGIEEWMDNELRQLYECEEQEDYLVEIDIDALLEENLQDRYKFVEDILTDVRLPVNTFINELLQKIKTL